MSKAVLSSQTARLKSTQKMKLSESNQQILAKAELTFRFFHIR